MPSKKRCGRRKQPSEFSIESLRLDELDSALASLQSCLTDYHDWIAKFGGTSIATAEALLNWTFDANVVVDVLVGRLVDNLYESERRQTGPAYLLNIVSEITRTVTENLPEEPDVLEQSYPTPYPGVVRISKDTAPPRFPEHLIAQVQLALDITRGWKKTAAEPRKPVGRTVLRSNQFAKPEDPIPEAFQREERGKKIANGPLQGSQIELAWAIDPRQGRVPRGRQLEGLHGTRVWIQRYDGRLCGAYFRTSNDLDRATTHLEAYRKNPNCWKLS